MSTKEKDLETKEQSESCCSSDKVQKEEAARLEKLEEIKKLAKEHKSGGCGSGCG